MPEDGKPAAPATQPTAPSGNEAQPQAPEQTANPAVEMSDSVRSYLKGLGLENIRATPELVKIAEAGMKQKESVSRISFEKEQLLARLESQGKDTTVTEPQEPQAPSQPSAPAPQPQEQSATVGVSDNDLFDLARMITTDFKELAPEAQDGSIFRELRQLGYFTSKGVDKKAVYDYLAGKNAQAAELRELREFKQKYSQPNPADNPMYNPTPGYAPDAPMDNNMARSIVMSGNTDNQRYNEAVTFLRNELLNSK